MSSPLTTTSGATVGPIGYGMMNHTWLFTNPNLPTREASYSALNAALAAGANFWNGGENYTDAQGKNSTHLLADYLEKYPENKEKVFVSIKGGMPGTEEGIKRSVEHVLDGLAGKKEVDIFQCARVDPKVPVEETLGYLKKYKDAGKIRGIGLSEVKASTIERAVKVVDIVAVEAEVSLWSPDVLKNGVAETCARLGLPIIAYSPLSRGGLTGALKTFDELPEGDPRRAFPKFQADALKNNLKLSEQVAELAKRKGVSSAQVGINWVRCLSGRTMNVQTADGETKKITLGTIIPIPGSTKVERIKENSTVVDLTDEEMDELMAIVENNPIVSALPMLLSLTA
jgi:pyridoxine 4-dehydrogenase